MEHNAIIKSVFCDTINTYCNTLTNYYPSFESIGFTERNLTFNFCHNYFSIYQKAKIWQEVPINKKNEKGKYDEHFDSLIIDEANKLLIFIEAKRLNSGNKLESINADYARLKQDFSKIYNYDKFQEFTKYGILLADIWIPRLKPNKKQELLSKFETFCEDINSEILQKEVVTPNKISTNEEYHLLCCYFKL